MLISKRQRRLRRSRILRWLTNVSTATAIAVMSILPNGIFPIGIFPNGAFAGGLRSVQIQSVKAQPIRPVVVKPPLPATPSSPARAVDRSAPATQSKPAGPANSGTSKSGTSTRRALIPTQPQRTVQPKVATTLQPTKAEAEPATQSVIVRPTPTQGPRIAPAQPRRAVRATKPSALQQIANIFQAKPQQKTSTPAVKPTQSTQLQSSGKPSLLQSVLSPTSNSTHAPTSPPPRSSTGRASQRRNPFAKPGSAAPENTVSENAPPPATPTIATRAAPTPTPHEAYETQNRKTVAQPSISLPRPAQPFAQPTPQRNPQAAAQPTPAKRLQLSKHSALNSIRSTLNQLDPTPREIPLIANAPRRLQADVSQAAPIIGSDFSVTPRSATAFSFSDSNSPHTEEFLSTPAPIVDAPIVDAPIVDAPMVQRKPDSISDREVPELHRVYSSPQTQALREAAKRIGNRAANDPLSDRTPASGHSGPMKPYKLMKYQDNVPAAERPPFQVVERAGEFSVSVGRNKILRSDFDIYRSAVVDPSICEVSQFTPREVAIVGKRHGTTEVTFWMAGEDTRPASFLIRVTPNVAEVQRQEDEYVLLEQLLLRQFPNSKVELTVLANKLIVEGQVRDIEDAAQILALLRSDAYGAQNQGARRNGLNEGTVVAVLPNSATGRDHNGLQIINMLKLPGIQQVALKVRIAKLVRSAGRNTGIKFNANIGFSDSNTGALLLESLASANASPSVLAKFDANDIEIGLNYLQSQGVIRMLAEPTLVAKNGETATFHSGGEFAIPTVVGSVGSNAVTTNFKAYGTMLSFQPTILDKDRIQIQLSPEFSQIDAGNSVGGTPGTSTTNVNTTVIMREGQTMAIASLIDESFTASKAGSIPWLSKLLGPRSVSRNETELIILVTPELVHPMDPEEVPPLPGFDVTEPTPSEFWQGKIEGHPARDFNSTRYPHLDDRYQGTDRPSGPFGHGQ
ncbi:MAG: pilus assembly protein CpaC [Pirellulaceae bacterium]|jgi:pilus assembly protein CpaC